MPKHKNSKVIIEPRQASQQQQAESGSFLPIASEEAMLR